MAQNATKKKKNALLNMIYAEAAIQGFSQSGLWHKAGMYPNNASKALNPRYDTIKKLADAIGFELTISKKKQTKA